MEIPVIFIFTHDSIGVGEDGPTHQPIEHWPPPRIPGLIALRPGDANEVAEAWRVIMDLRHQPVCLVLSRQNMPTLDRTKFGAANGVHKGAYVVADADGGGKPEVILIGHRHRAGADRGRVRAAEAGRRPARVVSMPSWELFEEQDEAYRDSVLPPDVTARVSVEMAGTFGWRKSSAPTASPSA